MLRLIDAATEAIMRLRLAGLYCPAQTPAELALAQRQMADDAQRVGWSGERLLEAVEAYRTLPGRLDAQGAPVAKPWPDLGALRSALGAADAPSIELDLRAELNWLVALAQGTVPDGLDAVGFREQVLVRRYGSHLPAAIRGGLKATGWAMLALGTPEVKRAFVGGAARAIGEDGARRITVRLDGYRWQAGRGAPSALTRLGGGLAPTVEDVARTRALVTRLGGE